MSFADGWPRCQKILEMILCRLILSLAHCDLFAAMHILLQRSIALVNPGSSRAQLHLTIFILDEDSQGKGVGPGRWFAAQTLASEWKAWSMSLWELTRVSSNKLNSKLDSELEKGWCNCDLQLRWRVSHHTHHTVEALEKKAQGSQRCPRREVEV